MKLPKSFNVFGKKIRVKSGDLGPNYQGMFYPGKDLIVISNDTLPEEINRVLIHEFFHSVITRCSLDQVVSYPSEELLVDMFTKALLENFEIKCKK